MSNFWTFDTGIQRGAFHKMQPNAEYCPQVDAGSARQHANEIAQGPLPSRTCLHREYPQYILPSAEGPTHSEGSQSWNAGIAIPQVANFVLSILMQVQILRSSFAFTLAAARSCTPTWTKIYSQTSGVGKLALWMNWMVPGNFHLLF